MPSAVVAVCSSIAAVLIVRVLRSRYELVTTRLADLPGPPAPSYIIGNLEELAKAPTGTKLKSWRKKYGQTYKIRGSFMQPLLVLGDPRGASHVLQGKDYVRTNFDRLALEVFFGAKNLFCAEGDEHRRMRKYLNSAFTLQSVQQVSHVFFELADNLKQKWEDTLNGLESSVFDIFPTLHMLSLDAINKTMFMHDLSASQSKIPSVLREMSNSSGEDVWISSLLKAFASVFPSVLYLPSPLKKYGNILQTEFGKITRDASAGKDEGAMHAKVVDALLQAKKDGEPISQEEIVAQTIGVMFAGSETTANLIAECLYELARNSRIQQKLRDEISDFMSAKGKTPDFEDLMSPTTFPYLDAVVRETLRTKGALQDLRRVAIHDDVIPLQFPILGTNKREIHVKAGQIIHIPVRDGINVDEAIWGADVAEYKPERWLEPGSLPHTVESIHAQGRTLSFSDGPKSCLGRIFAIAEIKIVVTSLVSHFAFEDTGVPLDFYILGGSTAKPFVKGREAEGVQLPLKVKTLQ